MSKITGRSKTGRFDIRQPSKHRNMAHNRKEKRKKKK